MHTLEKTEALILNLISELEKNKDVLAIMNEKITHDTSYWIENDYTFTIAYLKAYLKNHSGILQQIKKPRGKILIILSYNEPFILSVIPIFNAILAGNDVTVRPSSISREFCSKIWSDSGITHLHKLKLEYVSWSVEEIYQHISDFNDIYFFDSQDNAKNLAAECGKQYVVFHPEIEGADTKVILHIQPEDFSVTVDAEVTVREAFTHSGQSCQRIHGIFIPNTILFEYVEALKSLLNNDNIINQHLSPTFSPNAKSILFLEQDISQAKSEQILYPSNQTFPLIVVNPIHDSEFVKNAYFLPTLWVIGYNTEKELFEYLNNRYFRLGLNIISGDSGKTDLIVEKTLFSRYTVNSSHIDIRLYEGWGGINPTGFSGYITWFEHFSYPAIVIDTD